MLPIALFLLWRGRRAFYRLGVIQRARGNESFVLVRAGSPEVSGLRIAGSRVTPSKSTKPQGKIRERCCPLRNDSLLRGGC